MTSSTSSDFWRVLTSDAPLGAPFADWDASTRGAWRPRVVPTTPVRDRLDALAALVGLTRTYASREDASVPCSAEELLRAAGLYPATATARRAFDDGLMALVGTVLEGQEGRRQTVAPLLILADRLPDQPGPRPREEVRPSRSVIQWSQTAARLLLHADSGWEHALEAYSFLPPDSATRNMVAWLTTLPLQAEVPIDTVAHIAGWTAMANRPGALEARIVRLHETLLQDEWLAEEPVFTRAKAPGVTSIHYVRALEPPALKLPRRIIWQLEQYGLPPRSAARIALTHRAEAVRALAALETGNLAIVGGGLATTLMQAIYTSHGSFVQAAVPQADQPLGLSDASVVSRARTERERRLSHRPEISMGRMGARASLEVSRVLTDAPAWVTEGWTNVVLNQTLDINPSALQTDKR